MVPPEPPPFPPGQAAAPLTLWDTATGRRVAEFPPVAGPYGISRIPEVRGIPGTTLAAVQAKEDEVRIHDLSTGEAVGRPLSHHGQVMVLVASDDGRRLLTVAGDGTAQLWDTRTGEPAARAMRLPTSDFVTDAFFCAGGNAVITVSGPAWICVWDAATGDPVGEPLDQGGAKRVVTTAAILHEGTRRLVTRSH